MKTYLTADTNFYVSPAGSDSNDGINAPWLTAQHAIDSMRFGYNLAGYKATVNFAAGDYAGFSTFGEVDGMRNIGSLKLMGDETNPDNVRMNGLIALTGGAKMTLTGVQTNNPTGAGLSTDDGGTLLHTYSIHFAAADVAHAIAGTGSRLKMQVSGYKITGPANSFINASGWGQVQIYAYTSVTIENSPHFATAFALAVEHGLINVGGVAFINGDTVTGQKYGATFNGVIYTGGMGVDYFPGNVAGNVGCGGQYG